MKDKTCVSCGKPSSGKRCRTCFSKGKRSSLSVRKNNTRYRIKKGLTK